MTSHQWGRVADDGTVFVKTADGERSVGQYPEGTPDEALKFFTERYDALAFEVGLLEQRVKAAVLSPDEAATSVRTVREQVVDANAVGDLASLVARLDALGPVIAQQREARKAERAQRAAESKTAKEALVAEAEKLAEGNDWRDGANRLRDLLDQWKALPRIDRASDDALWRRFSTARTAYTRRRKSHFAEQHEKRDAARVVKEQLAKEAESLADSRDWGPTAGPLPRPDEAVEGRRAGARATSTTRCGSASAAPRTPSSAPATRPRPSRTRSSPPTPRSRRSSWSRPRRWCRSPTSTPRRRRCATSPSAGRPPARCPGTG